MADGNLFLRRLSTSDAEWLSPRLKRVALATNTVVAEQDSLISTAYLPLDCILSVITVTRDGRAVESRTIGRESGFGLMHALGSRYSPERVVIQVSGDAWTAPLPALSELAARSPDALRTLASFAQATVVQSTVSVACNALHAVEQRLCRWLLLTQDRLNSDVLPLTQEHLSIMLAVQRTTVTAAAIRLQETGAIRYSRGKIRVIDRDQLLACACECYEHIEQCARRLVGEDITPGDAG